MPEVRVCKCCNQEKPVTEFFKNRLGYTYVCNECATSRRKENRKKKSEVEVLRKNLEDKRKMAISDFTPRELMAQLKRLGYKFKMEYTETHIIDSNDIEI